MAREQVGKVWRRYDGLPTKVHIGIVIIAIMMIVAPFLSAAGSGGAVATTDNVDVEGFFGLSERSTVPASRATLVAFDSNDLMDDLAYLAAVPASTFYSEADGVTITSPLMFYQPPMDSPSEKETALDAGVGIEYLMEDYVTAAGSRLTSLTTIDVPRSEAEGLAAKWNADQLVTIDGGEAAGTAARIATSNWEWARTSVIAVVDPSVRPIADTVTGNLSGTVPSVPSSEGSFSGSIGPSFHSESSHPFEVGDQYKYVQAVLEWSTPGPFPGLTQRGKELGLHLYQGEIMVALSTEWNAFTGPLDTAQSFVYTPGPWRAAVVFIPTMGFNAPGYDSPSYASR
ncbi:MAG: hypothetical protein KAJ35_09755, partial [Thermoplasmata archaeon]|nr:hypothetical protein [Thermoplasmata archaeon]